MPTKQRDAFLTSIGSAIYEIDNGVIIQNADNASAPMKVGQVDTWLIPDTVDDYDESDFLGPDSMNLTTLVSQFRTIAENAPVGFAPIADDQRNEAIAAVRAIYKIVKPKDPEQTIPSGS